MQLWENDNSNLWVNTRVDHGNKRNIQELTCCPLSCIWYCPKMISSLMIALQLIIFFWLQHPFVDQKCKENRKCDLKETDWSLFQTFYVVFLARDNNWIYSLRNKYINTILYSTQRWFLSSSTVFHLTNSFDFFNIPDHM